jgi:hypothetical protein
MNYEDVKPWIASRTVWGGAVALIASASTFFGYTLTAEDQASIVEVCLQLATLAGSAMAIYFRIKAKKRIE